MDYSYQDLLDSLRTGYIDKSHKSKNQYIPRLLTNDKKSGSKVLATLISELKQCNKFWFSVAFVTNSGIQTLIQTLKELEDKSISGEILVSQYLNFTQPDALRRLLKFKNIKLKINTEDSFHSKGYLFQSSNLYTLIVGSSNLTASALCSNKELNLKVNLSPNSYLLEKSLHEFQNEFENAFEVTDEFINKYEEIYLKQSKLKVTNSLDSISELKPNLMQSEALNRLIALRTQGKNKALLISATGTGKTFLSAFDVKALGANKVLFVVHRENIARAAMAAYKLIFGNSYTYGFYSGNKKDENADFIFSTIQTISKSENIERFDKTHFDYIVIDESHRAGAKTYHSVLNYFVPKFLLGMTATPERTDGEDIFSLYDHNIAYEIRLHAALEENLLSPFHYFGVTDLTVNGKEVDSFSDFKSLVASERVDRIIENSKLYGCDTGVIRGLIFCSRNEEAAELCSHFNNKGYKCVALSGESSDDQRADAISKLEADDESKIDYIFTVDIFNEGIDIPRVNQVIMLRPTQSAIIFVQQLGRGLRRAAGKEYLTVIDFIGNYANNFMIPIALYGDGSYNKNNLRMLVSTGSASIPGDSTINFDRIAKEKIYSAIDSASFDLSKDLAKDFDLLKFKIGKTPMMMDFAKYGSRDPYLYVTKFKSYLNYVIKKDSSGVLAQELKGLEFLRKVFDYISIEVNNSKRVDESVLLKMLIENESVSIAEFKKYISDKYNYSLDDKALQSVVHNLNLMFVTENFKGKLEPIGKVHSISICSLTSQLIVRCKTLDDILANEILRNYLLDSTIYSIYSYDQIFDRSNYVNGFLKYKKYSRKDVFRILGWTNNPVAQNVGGYIFNSDKTQCPIFVNYHKEDDIASSINYEDRFINNLEFEWMSKSNRTIASPEITLLREHKNLRTPLFVKKSNDEGVDFYYMGELTPIPDSFEQKSMVNDSDKQIPVVKISFQINPPVDDALFNYLEDK